MRTCIVSTLICIVAWVRLPAQSLPYLKYDNIPSGWRAPISKALEWYPELAHARIRFRVRHARSPLATNRDWMAFLWHFGRQAYIVTISDRTIPALSPILFDSLDDGAKLGVIGHELSHVSDFSRRNLFGWLSLGFGHLSSRYLDRMEFATDSLCIAHGLGCALLDWSLFVRHALQTHTWRGADNLPADGQPPQSKMTPALKMSPSHKMSRERYMNPETIMARLQRPCE